MFRRTPKTAAKKRKLPEFISLTPMANRAASEWRTGNEFSDHRFEKNNYLNLAGSKLRTCALGPELVIDPEFQSVPGEVTIERGGKFCGRRKFAPAKTKCATAFANIEHHHFKYEAHRRPAMCMSISWERCA